jgi:Putative capsular polysaccharide synthesis protein
MSRSITSSSVSGLWRLRRAVKRSYLLNSLYYRLKFRLSPLYRDNPLIIYQMGKVGSSTIQRSLRSHGLERPVYRVHFLVEDQLFSALRQVGMAPQKYFKRSQHIVHSRYLIRELARGQKRGHWQVITMVRDPIAQNISSFFQLIDLFIPDFEERVEARDLKTEELLEVFLEHYTPECDFNNWFEVAMKPVFDIDVFAIEYPQGAGYQIYRRENVSLLLLKLEDVNNSAPAAFREFLELENFRVVKKNDARAKNYYETYKSFRENAVFPRSYVDGIYSAKYARHFYTDEEIATFRCRINVGD